MGAGDPGNELQSIGLRPAGGEGLEPGAVLVGVERGGNDGARLQGRKGLGGGRPDAEEDICTLDGIGGGLGHTRTCGGIVSVKAGGSLAGSGLDSHGEACSDKLANGLGRGGDPGFPGLGLTDYGDDSHGLVRTPDDETG